MNKNTLKNRIHPYRGVTIYGLSLWLFSLCLVGNLFLDSLQAQSTTAMTGEIRDLSVNGQLGEGVENPGFTISGTWNPKTNHEDEPLRFHTIIDGSVKAGMKSITEKWTIKLQRLRGKWDELSIEVNSIYSQADIKISVSEEAPFFHTIQADGNPGRRFLKLILDKEKEGGDLADSIEIVVESIIKTSAPLSTFTPIHIKSKSSDAISGQYIVESESPLNLSPIKRGKGALIDRIVNDEDAQKISRKSVVSIFGLDYMAEFQLAPDEPDLFKNAFRDFNLEADFSQDDKLVKMTLTGIADFKHPTGGIIQLVGGDIGLVSYNLLDKDARLEFHHGQYVVKSSKPSAVPVEITFHCRIDESIEKNAVHVSIANSTIRPVELRGWSEDSSFEINPLGDVEQDGEVVKGFLRPQGGFVLNWKSKGPETSDKVFYSVQGTNQIGLGSGRGSQVAFMDFQVMQGELSEFNFEIIGEGEILRVDGVDILSWKILPIENSNNRQLVVETRRPIKGNYQVRIYSQQTLPTFPLTMTPLKVIPQGALAFGGYVRVHNQGAVKIEIQDTSNLTQVSPELFPRLGGFPNPGGNQVFAYRLSGTDYEFKVQADTILPDVSLSQLAVHTLGNDAQSIETLLELDIREAPLREFELILPEDYVLTRVEGNYIADYFLTTDEELGQKLRLVFSRPVSGRWAAQIELSRNQDLEPQEWAVPQIASPTVKTSRGHVGIAVDPGLRVSTASSEGVTEIAAAFFPKRIEGLALAFRLRDLEWNLSLSIEELEKSLQVDTLQLFSIGEGIIYGSSLLNYLVSGAPVTSFEVLASDTYANVEFVGKGIRNWRQTENGYEVFLENPVFGTYSLLATYDLKLENDDTSYPFEGIHPATAKNNQGYVLFISHYQVDMGTLEENADSNIVGIEPAEIPSEFRLLFDAPLVDAYQYTSYPFSLPLEVKQLSRGNSLQLLVDRVEVTTNVAADGQAVTLTEYFVKNKSNSHFRFQLPKGLNLWDVTVDGENAVTVSDKGDVLVPIKVKPNSNELIRVAIQTAYTPSSKKKMELMLPILQTSTLVTRWTVKSGDGKTIKFHKSNSSLEPDIVKERERGFDVVLKFLKGNHKSSKNFMLGLVIAFISLIFLILFAKLKKVFKFWKWVPVKLVSLVGLCIATIFVISSIPSSEKLHTPLSNLDHLAFSIPVSEPGAQHKVMVSILDKAEMGISCPAVIFFVVGIILLLGSFKWDSELKRTILVSLGWGFVLTGALTQYYGLPFFVISCAAIFILHLVLPVLRLRVTTISNDGNEDPTEDTPVSPDNGSDDSSSGSVAGTVTPLILAGLFLAASMTSSVAQNQAAASVQQQGRSQIVMPNIEVESINQKLKLEDKFLSIESTLIWRAQKGESLRVLGADAILQQIHFNGKNGVRVMESINNSNSGVQLFAESDGLYHIHLDYKVPLNTGNNQTSAALQTPASMSHLIEIDFGAEDNEVYANSLISRQKIGENGNKYKLVLKPQGNPTLVWQPRRRDARSEKAVYFAEMRNLFVPSAGVVDGRHVAVIRLAQGVLQSLEFDVHPSLTIVDVPSKNVKSWRFDPDSRKFIVDLVSPQTGAFSLSFLSQSGAGSLPYEKETGLVHIPGASGELGYAGVASPAEVQLDNVEAEGMASLSLEDFLYPNIQNVKFAQSTLRRAYQYSGTGGTLKISVSPVEPDVRAVTRMTLSLGEDRTLLAVQANISVTRSGIFKLQFPLPENFEVESLSGPAISHWTQNTVDDQELITIHLKSRTLGQTQVQMNLVGQGLLSQDVLDVPSIKFVETTKQTGTLIISPERGTSLHEASLSGTIQQKAATMGVSQKGTSVYKLLQKDWSLSFTITKLNPWLQVNQLQKVTFREGLAKTEAEFLLTIEHAGVDSLQVSIPTTAESVEINGKQVVDFVQTSETENNKTVWDIRFERRLIGQVPFRIRYQQPIQSQLNQWPLQIVEPRGANLFKVWVAYKSEGRLRVESPAEAQGFQPADWSSIPAKLRSQNSSAEGFARVLRKVNNSSSLTLQVIRNEVEKVLPARIHATKLISVMTLGGEMLTLVELHLDPREERQLTVQLPSNSKFWLGYINDKSVWPWKDGEKLLLPLEKNAGSEKISICKFIYSSRFSQNEIKNGKFNLTGPGFGLPLENIKWQVYLPDSISVEGADGNLDLRRVATPVQESGAYNNFNLLKLDNYLQNESQILQEQNDTAVQFLNLGNTYMNSGDNRSAQRAFENAINFSNSDPTFNEDARVQFQNIRNQQANIALNARVNNVYRKNSGKAVPMDYNNLSQSEMDQLLETSSEEDREAMERLADRLVRQQEAAVARPASIYATFPEMGQAWQLERSHLVEINKPLQVQLKLERMKPGFSWGTTVKTGGILILVSIVFFALTGLIRRKALDLLA